ncbi:MAG TPA: hypothetical protein VIT67_21640 [Povalibacter sp.]
MHHVRAAAIALLLISTPLFADDNDPVDCKALKSSYEGKTLYLQHNFYHEDGEATWINFMKTGDFLPVGAAVLVKKLKSDEAILQIKDETGREHEVEWDLDEALPDCATALQRTLGESAPSMDGLSEADIDGIKRGAISEGMSRKAVFLAVGYPPYLYERPWSDTTARNKDLVVNELTFVGSTYDYVIVKFDADRVKAIDD